MIWIVCGRRTRIKIFLSLRYAKLFRTSRAVTSPHRAREAGTAERSPFDVNFMTKTSWDCRPCKAKRQINRLKCIKENNSRILILFLQFRIDICRSFISPARSETRPYLTIVMFGARLHALAAKVPATSTASLRRHYEIRFLKAALADIQSERKNQRILIKNTLKSDFY